MDPYIFVSYSREDGEIVRTFAGALAERGLKVWIDVDSLQPGQSWELAIEDALRRATAMVVFVSHATTQSPWVQRELRGYIQGAHGLVIPVILDDVPIGADLSKFQWIDMRGDRSEDRLAEAAAQVARSVEAHLVRGDSGVRIPDAQVLAKETAEAIRTPWTKVSGEGDAAPDSIFIVHGHDETFLSEVEAFVAGQGIRPIVLKRDHAPQQSLYHKFISQALPARFAIVLVTPDDMGASVSHYNHPKGGEYSLRFRARQNVIYELGFFYGRLGWEKVFVIQKKPSECYPEFEPPSDLGGVLFPVHDDDRNWQPFLLGKLAEAGFKVTAAGD
jgi:predicted nucleotide-binding protein